MLSQRYASLFCFAFFALPATAQDLGGGGFGTGTGVGGGTGTGGGAGTVTIGSGGVSTVTIGGGSGGSAANGGAIEVTVGGSTTGWEISPGGEAGGGDDIFSGLLIVNESPEGDQLREILITRIGNIDYVNLDLAMPGYVLKLSDFYRAGGFSPPVISPSNPVRPLIDPLDFTKLIVGPLAAGGAILGLYTSAGTAVADTPPTIDFLKTDKSQDGYVRKCQAAVDALLPLRGKHYEACGSKDDNQFAECRTAVRNYARSCLAFANVPPDAVREPDSAPVLDAQVLERMGRVTGVLYHDSDDPALRKIYCTAVRVSKNWLLTARHCGFHYSDGEWFMREPKELRFLAFGNPERPIGVKYARDPLRTRSAWEWESNNAGGDYLFLNIDTDDDPGGYPELAEPQLWDKIVLFSFAVTALIDAGHTDTTDEELVANGRWTDFMVYDASRTCMVAAKLPPNCIVYPCQAEIGSSGSPLFRVTEDDVLQVVGIHTGPVTVGGSDACADPQVLGLVNLGVTPRTEDAKAALN